MKDEYQCVGKRCRHESSVIYEGKPLCQNHYEQELDRRFGAMLKNAEEFTEARSFSLEEVV